MAGSLFRGVRWRGPSIPRRKSATVSPRLISPNAGKRTPSEFPAFRRHSRNRLGTSRIVNMERAGSPMGEPARSMDVAEGRSVAGFGPAAHLLGPGSGRSAAFPWGMFGDVRGDIVGGMLAQI